MTQNGQQNAISCIFVNYIRLSEAILYCIHARGTAAIEDISRNNAFTRVLSHSGCLWQKEPALPKHILESEATARPNI